MRTAILLTAFCAAAYGGQSVSVFGATASTAALPNAAPWYSLTYTSMRWEMRIHGYSTAVPGTNSVDVGAFHIQDCVGGKLCASTGGAGIDSINDNYAGTDYSAYGGDILIRVQRDLANSRYTLEVCAVGGACSVPAATKILTPNVGTLVGRQITLYSGSYRVAFLRWYSSTVTVGTAIPVAATAAGDLGDWEFEGDGKDSSGHNLTIGTALTAFSPTPVYAPLCNAGAPRGFRAGYRAQLDGSGSQPLDGGSALSYLWQQLSGPSEVNWTTPRESSERAQQMAQPALTGMIAGTYGFQLTVTDASGASSTCTVKHGAVATDDKGAVITGSKTFDQLMGPVIRYGANPWPWFDNRHKADADVQIANMDTYYGAYWDTPATGTVSVTNGSRTITGAGTSFTTDLCGGPANPSVPNGKYLLVWHPSTVAPGQFGRLQVHVDSCESDTQITVHRPSGGEAPWGAATAPGLNYSIISGPYGTDTDPGTKWFYGNAPVNYYDNVAAFYSLYYRSGIEAYRTAARKLADRFWVSPQVDRGECHAIRDNWITNGNCFAGRSASLMGLMLRAADGRPDMWPGIYLIVDHAKYLFNWYRGYSPGLYDTREVGYSLAAMAECALAAPDDTYAAGCRQVIDDSMAYFGARRMPAGNFPTFSYNRASWETPASSVTLTNGSKDVVGTGMNWTAGMFPYNSNFGTQQPIWFTNSPSAPGSNADGDATWYQATFVDATHLTLDRPYEGASGTHGWATMVWDIGFYSQPFTEGILARAFGLAARAVATSSPANAATLRTYQGGIVNWLMNYGYWPAAKGMFYFAGSVRCPNQAVAASVPGCADSDSLYNVDIARVYNAETMHDIGDYYAYTCATACDASVKTFGDTLYSAMWSKPGAGGPDPDGHYVSAMDDGAIDMSGTPPLGAAPKWFGMFFGFGNLASWPVHRNGTAEQYPGARSHVAFDLQAVPGAARVRVTTTAPSGAIEQQKECGATPCALDSGPEHGDRLVRLEYLSADGKVLASSRKPVVQTQ